MLCIVIHALFVAVREIYEIFGSRVARAREAAGLTQAQVAEAVGLSRASVANIEAGRQRVLLHQVFDLAHALKAASVFDILPADLSPRAGRIHGPVRPVATTGSKLDPTQERIIAEIVDFLALEDQK